MNFPKYIRMATNVKITTVQLNSTAFVSKKVFYPSFANFIDILAKTLGFSYQLLTPQDGEVGRELSNGSWTGIIGMIQRNEADMAVSGLSITLSRTKVVKFSYPFQKTRVTFATRKAEYRPELTAFLGPYSLEVWLFIMTCLIAMPLVLNILFQRKYPLKSFIWYSYGTFVFQAVRIQLKKTGDYMLLAFWITGVTILGYCYRAVLLSFLSFPHLENIHTIPQLANAVNKGKYQCTTYPGSFIAGFFATSNEPNIKIIGKNLLKNNGSTNIPGVLSNEESEKKPAFVGGENHLNPLKMKYIVSEETLMPVILAIPMRKDFCCKARLDRVISYIWASGIYAQLIKDEGFNTSLKSLLQSPADNEKYTLRQLSVDDLGGVFITLILGYVLSILVFFFEIITHKLETLFEKHTTVWYINKRTVRTNRKITKAKCVK